MRKWLFLLLIMGCGEQVTCDYQYSGICFVSDTEIDGDEVDLIVETMEIQLLRHYPDTPSLPKFFEANNVVVELTDLDLMVDCESLNDLLATKTIYNCDIDISGVNYDGDYIIIERHSCLNNGAFTHELLHTFETFHLGISPPDDHLTPYLFDQYYTQATLTPNEAVEHQVRVEVRRVFGSCHL